MITTLSQLVAQTESAGKITALRFEPAFKCSQKTALKCAEINRVSYPTAEIICKSSWGLYQIMGENLYSMGLKVPVLEYWQNPTLQQDFFNLFISLRYINFTLEEVINDQEKREKFALRYNGSRVYADRLLNIYKSSISQPAVK